MTGWISTAHRCPVPPQYQVQRQAANADSIWKCPTCLVEWKLEINNQIGYWVNQTTGLRRQIGFLP